MSVDVDTLVSGMAALPGTTFDSENVLIRTSDEIQKMITTRASLIAKESLPAAAADSWNQSIAALGARLDVLQSECDIEYQADITAGTAGTGTSAYWADVQALAVDVANASNTLEGQDAATPDTSISGLLTQAQTALTTAGATANSYSAFLVIAALMVAAALVYVEVKK